jgi:hypothetical protein
MGSTVTLSRGEKVSVKGDSVEIQELENARVSSSQIWWVLKKFRTLSFLVLKNSGFGKEKFGRDSVGFWERLSKS